MLCDAEPTSRCSTRTTRSGRRTCARSSARAVTAGRVIQETDPTAAAARDQAFLAAGKRDFVVGEPGAFDLRMPGLASGILDPEAVKAGAPPPVGELFPQPLVHIDGATVRLDDLYHGGWAIVAGEGAPELFTDDVRDAWSELSPVFAQVGGEASGDWTALRENGDLLGRWLAEGGAAIVRPDLYVYGIARSEADLLRLAGSIRAQISG